MGTKSKNAGNGKDNHADVVETNQPSETASTMSAVESGDADESMNMVKPGTEAWRLIHSRYAQNTTEMISWSLFHDRADKYMGTLPALAVVVEGHACARLSFVFFASVSRQFKTS